jgi:arylsulfatase A-like enzyme
MASPEPASVAAARDLPREALASDALVLPATISRPLLLSGCAALADAALNLHLFLRSAPLGGRYVLDTAPLLSRALYYGTWSHALVALPFVLFGIWRERRGRGRSWPADALQLALSAALLLIGAVDREFQRFLGMHVTLAWLSTYAAVGRTPAVIWDALRADRGGAWSSLWGVFAALAYVALAPRAARVRLPARLARLRVGAPLIVLLLVWPTILWNFIPGGVLRQNKVRPALITLVREARRQPVVAPDQGALRAATALYQQDWLARSRPGAFVFDTPDYPLRKRALSAPPARAARPNIIVLSLETFRAKEMASLNPDAPRPSATPFLDQLAQRPDSAAYRRYYASGVPTAFAFMSIHTSLLMHPRRNLTSEATSQQLGGFPDTLRRHGYRTLHFTGSDPDWDSQRVWLTRWYDEVHFSPADKELDRRTFRRAAERLREVGRSDRPFFAYLVSISNHTPFRNPEPQLAISDGKSSRDALRNTMRYTDDVVRELYESLSREPWFARTVWVITGDHGFDLGDRGEILGHTNLRHETTWVPLIVHGQDARLPRGINSCVGSHVDLAPTLAGLAGVSEADSYMGHSLLDPSCEGRSALILSAGHYAYETDEFSLYKPPGAPAFVYAGSDLEQRAALASPPQSLLRRAADLAQATQLLVAYTVDFDRHSLPEPAGSTIARVQEPARRGTSN